MTITAQTSAQKTAFAMPTQEAAARKAHQREQRYAEALQTHSPQLYRFLLHKSGNAEDAQDLLQQTLLKAFSHQAQLRDEEALQAWLFGIARREWASFFRKRNNRDATATMEPDEPTQLWDDAIRDPESALLAKEEEDLLRSAVALLPEHERRVLDAFYFAEQGYQEIASTEAISHSAIASRLHKARQRLKLHFQRSLGGFAYIGSSQGSIASGWLMQGFAFLLVTFFFIFPFALIRGVAIGLDRWVEKRLRLSPLWIITSAALVIVGISFTAWKMGLVFLLAVSGTLSWFEGAYRWLSRSKQTTQPHDKDGYIFSFGALLLVLALLCALGGVGGRQGPLAAYISAWIGATLLMAKGISGIFVGLTVRQTTKAPPERHMRAGTILLLVGVVAIFGIELTMLIATGRMFSHQLFQIYVVASVMAGLFLIVESLANTLQHTFEQQPTRPFLYLAQASLGVLLMYIAISLA